MKTLLWLLLAALLAGCGPKPVTKRYDAADERPITCLRALVVPPDEALQKSLAALYPFDGRCDVTLEVRHKENVCCNSTHNAARKNLGPFPRHFLRLEVRRGLTPLYSYYVDLDHPADGADLRRAFERVRHDLGF
ncbi:hypothetical protein [Hydrogenimonas sp.]